jgi:hypothetical protein
MADLGHRTTIPFFVFSLGAAIAVVATFAGGQVVAEAAPAIEPLTNVAVWASRVAVVILTARQFLKAWWPHRSFSQARRAKQLIPDLELELSQLRETEFETRRAYTRARQDAELCMRRIVAGRRALVPRRPRFISSQAPPPVPALSTV